MTNETAQNRYDYIRNFTRGIWNIVFDTYIWRCNYMLIFHLWPLILIVLGGEILYYSFFAPEKSGTYDFAAVVILIMIVFFAMCMAGADMVFSHMPKDAFDKWW